MTAPLPPGQTLRYWLGKVMHDAREKAGVKPRKVSELADVDASSINRFEAGRVGPTQVDTYLAAYAELLGVEDPRVFYDRALRRWKREGEAPRLAADDAATTAQRAVEQAARRAQQVRDAQPKKHDGTQKKRANG